MVDYVSPLSFTGTGDRNNLAAHPFDNDNLGASFSSSNSVKYTSANLYGLQFGGQYSFSNSTDFATNRAYSVGASYKNGPLSVGAGYMQLNGAGTTTSGAVLAADDDNAFWHSVNVFGVRAVTTRSARQRSVSCGPTRNWTTSAA
jgi:predicted porin